MLALSDSLSAFNITNHEVLTHLVTSAGVDGAVLWHFCSFLSKKSQRLELLAISLLP